MSVHSSDQDRVLATVGLSILKCFGLEVTLLNLATSISFLDFRLLLLSVQLCIFFHLPSCKMEKNMFIFF